VDPATGAPAPATAVVARLLAVTLDALHANGDDVLVVDGLSRILRDGTGADLQRRALPRADGLVEVVRAAVAATHGETVVDEAPADEPRPELRASAA
jgi:carboxylate-amine ligase